MLSFLQHSLRPWLINIEAEITRRLLPARTAYFAEFSLDAMQRSDTKSRYESYAIGVDKGFLTVEDIRKWENLPPLLRTAPEVTSAD
jgi:HK97 family phage portal protein